MRTFSSRSCDAGRVLVNDRTLVEPVWSEFEPKMFLQIEENQDKSFVLLLVLSQGAVYSDCQSQTLHFDLCIWWCFRFLHFPVFHFVFCPSSPDFVPDSWLSWFPLPGLCTYSNTNVKPVCSSWFNSVEVWCLHVQIFAIVFLFVLFPFPFLSSLHLRRPSPPLLFSLHPSFQFSLTPSLHSEGKWDCVEIQLSPFHTSAYRFRGTFAFKFQCVTFLHRTPA